MKFYFITNSPQLAGFVVERGVDRIFLDLELLGKHERQGHINTLISDHSLADVEAVRRAVPGAEITVRLNPVNARTQAEIDGAIDAGADVLMLPMFRASDEVKEFSDRTAGRARICLLAETRGAMENIADCAAVDGVDEVHIGLNDLSLDLGLPFMFQPLALGLVDAMAAEIGRIGKPFGIGGVARVDEGLLPAQMILGEHARLGSTAAILSRTFHRQAQTVAEIEADMDFAAEIEKLRLAYAAHRRMSDEALAHNHAGLVDRVHQIVGAIQRGRVERALGG